MTIRKLNILLTTIGGVAFPNTINAFRSFKKGYKIYIYGTDKNENAVGKFFVDKLNHSKNKVETNTSINLKAFEEKNKVTDEVFIEIEEGLNRVKEIVSNLKSYSRTVPGERNSNLSSLLILNSG